MISYKKEKIIYILPTMRIFGGVAVVLQHANRLVKRGYDVSIVSLDRNSIDVSWFPGNIVSIDLFCENKSYDDVDIVIATHFSTIDVVKKIKTKRKIYFIQSDERRFSEDFIYIQKCEKTYKERDFEYMTEAIWIQRWLKEEFGHDAYYVPNGLDETLFHKTSPLIHKKNKPRILIEGSINRTFKGMADAYNAVKNLDCELWIISNDGKPKKDWKYDKFLEKVPMGQMKEIYSACDIFLKMSRVEGFFGPPLEAMACECAVVVGKCTGYDEYIIDEKNALVVTQANVEEATKSLQRLINDVELRKTLIVNGEKTAKKWSWNRSIDMLEKVIQKDVIKVFYDEKFPEKYDYAQVMKNIYQLSAEHHYLDSEQKKQQIEKVEQQIQQRNVQLKNKNKLVKQMQSSKFWRMQKAYVKLKSIIGLR